MPHFLWGFNVCRSGFHRPGPNRT